MLRGLPYGDRVVSVHDGFKRINTAEAHNHLTAAELSSKPFATDIADEQIVGCLHLLLGDPHLLL